MCCYRNVVLIFKLYDMPLGTVIYKIALLDLQLVVVVVAANAHCFINHISYIQTQYIYS